MGPLESAFAKVTEKLATIYPDAADWCWFGATEQAAADVPPRIVWVPIVEGYGPSVGQGGDGVNNPRPVATRQSQVAVHLWAAAAEQSGQTDQYSQDMEAGEALLNAFMWAAYSVYHGSPPLPFGPGTGAWAKGNTLGQNITLGVGYILPLTVWIPVTRPVAVTTRVTKIRATITSPTDPVVMDIE